MNFKQFAGGGAEAGDSEGMLRRPHGADFWNSNDFAKEFQGIHKAGGAETGDSEGILRRPHCADFRNSSDFARISKNSQGGAPRPGTRRVYSRGLTART